MTDPKRLLEENGDALESAMLRSVRGDGVTPEGRQRIFAGLGIVGAAVTTSAGAASSIVAAKTGLFKWSAGAAMKWIAISSAVALVPASVLVARSYKSAATREPVPTVQPANVAPRSAPVAVLAPITDTAVAEPAAPPAPARDAKRPQVSSPTLSDEVAALQVARTALAQHDPNAAIAALDRYKSRYASGRLSPEATVLRIEALVQRGDRAEATQLADRFEAANPKSPYADRIRSIVRGAGNSAR